MQAAIDNYLDHGAVVFPVELIKLSRSSDPANPKIKKVVRYPNEWSSLTLEVADRKYRGSPYAGSEPKAAALLCGAPSGFVVVDVDSKNDFDNLLEALGLTWNDLAGVPRVKSSENSYHLYFAYDQRLTKKALKVKHNDIVYDVDFLTNGCNIIAPPTKFEYTNGDDKITKEYVWEGESPWFDDLPALPEELVELWLSCISV